MVGTTAAGVVLGTAAYMSPEQARGAPIDTRTDIWAFGVVLFEALSGTNPFARPSIADTIGAIVAQEPDWTLLPEATPRHLTRLLRRCLAKDVTRRLRDIGDAAMELEDGLELEVREHRPESNRRGARWPWILATVVLSGALALSIARDTWRPTAPTQEAHVDIVTPPTADALSLAISPDGTRVVFVATTDGQSRLWLRALSSNSAQPITDTHGAAYPFWSPDSQSIGFFAEGALKRVDLGGGRVRRLASAPGGRGGT
jgi:serine/threonine protein kinase